MLYVNKTGCQWRNLPDDYHVWQTVYYYYRVWAAEGELKELCGNSHHLSNRKYLLTLLKAKNGVKKG